MTDNITTQQTTDIETWRELYESIGCLIFEGCLTDFDAFISCLGDRFIVKPTEQQ
jgi:hypothetical protein